MSHARTNVIRIARGLGLAALTSLLVAALGCGFTAGHSTTQLDSDPLHLGAAPGPQGSVTPSPLQLRLGSEPMDRIVSLSLTFNSLQATNSGAGQINLITDPVTVEFTRSGLVTEPISLRGIYQDTYSSLVFPAMTAQVVFIDVNGQLASQSVPILAQTIPFNFTLGSDAMVLNVFLDLPNSFTITDPAGFQNNAKHSIAYSGSSFVSEKGTGLALTTQITAPPDANSTQPEAGNIVFMVGTVTSVDTTGQTITFQPSSGDATQFSYTVGTQFVDCDPTALNGMMVEAQASTQHDGSILVSQVSLIDSAATRSELYGTLTGFAPEGIDYNMVVDGGAGLNVSSSLVGNNVTIDWLGDASYAVNSTNVDLTKSDDLIFDESHVFPGQFVGVQWDSLVMPDPDSSNVGVMQPGLFELNQQTLIGTVSNYAFDAESGLHTFTLNLAANSALRTMNPGFVSVTVRQTSTTYLRNNPTFSNGDTVKVRGLLFSDPNYSNVDYLPNPPNPVAFIMVAGRISK